MSDTPETDKNTWSDSSDGVLYNVVTAEFSKRLERERDEARHEIEGWRNKWECAIDMGARAMVERDEARSLEAAVDTIMSAPISDILRLFRERGVIPQFTTMNVSK